MWFSKASDFFGIWEESISNLWKTLLEGELKTTHKHVRAHDPVVLSDEDDTAAVFVLLLSDVTISHDGEFGSVFISASLILHEFCILLLDVWTHFLYILLVIFTAHDLELWLDEFNHGLSNQILECVQVSTSIVSSLVLKLDLHLISDLVQAVVTLFHFKQLR